jgi:hypothetical protein
MSNELTTFIRELVSTPNDAKNLWSNLLGNYNSKDKVKPLLDFYNQLPEEYKDKKVFKPIVIKYFMQFPMNQENYLLYQNYVEIFSDQTKAEIIEKNAHWDFSNEKMISFKSTNEIVKVLKNLKNKREKLIPVLKKYEKNIIDIALKDYFFIEKLKKYDLIKFLLVEDYGYTKLFFDKTQKNFQDILLSDNLWKFLLFVENTFNNVFLDIQIIGKEKIKEHDKNFYDLDIQKEMKENNVLDVFLNYVLDNEKKDVILQYYQEELVPFFTKMIEQKISLKDIYSGDYYQYDFIRQKTLLNIRNNEKKYMSMIYQIFLNEEMQKTNSHKKGMKI